ncbi:tetratricopeptide repeat protein [Tautonia rosea]|uniref:tetratricopeptide repeat protein n=1 Tax=Tautonia rosea TaxID=2728037 RepID=UPI0014747AEF|nr:tetratricopeptide repeat protein [Tautonia rosea]
MTRQASTTLGGDSSLPRRSKRSVVRTLAIVVLAAVAVAGPVGWGISRSRAYRVWSADRALNQGEPERAIDRLGPWKTSDDPRAVAIVARAQIARGNPESALRLLEARLAHRVELGWLQLLGETALSVGDLTRAIEAFEALNARQPDHPPTLARLAELSEPLRGPAEADRRYQDLERLEPENPEWPKQRGRILLGTDRYALSAKTLEASLLLAPNDSEARLWLAEALYLSGDPAASLEQLEICRQDEGGRNDRVEVARAECLRALGRTEEAAEVLDQLLDRSPNDADALRLRAELALERGAIDQAADLLNRAVTESPSDWRIHYQLSIVLARLGRDEEARHHAERMTVERERARFAPAR